MSLPAITWAFKQNLRPAERFVLVALADFADEDSRAFPSVETLARKTGHGRRTVVWALQRLRTLGLIGDTGERLGRTGRVKVWAVNSAKSASNSAAAARLNGAAAAHRTVSTLTVREPKRQLSRFIDFLKEDARFDGLDVEREIERAIEWCEKKNRAVTERFLENWLLHAEQPLEDDDEEASLAGEAYYSWEGWTEERRRAMRELWPGSQEPPERWDKVSPSVKEQIEARVKEGWP
jgi:hypothetical protein